MRFVLFTVFTQFSSLIFSQGQGFLKEYQGVNSNTVYAYGLCPLNNGGSLHFLNQSIGGEFNKLDANGNVIWSRSVGMGTSEFHYMGKVGQAADGNYFVLSYYMEMFNMYSGYQLLKTDTNGMMIWAKEYLPGTTVAMPSIHNYSNGDYVMAFGYPNKTRVIRTDASGNILWDRSFTPDTTGYKDAVLKIEKTENGGTLVLGYLTGGNFYLFELDTAGMVLWDKTYRPQNCTGALIVSDMTRLSNGEIALCGYEMNSSGSFYGCLLFLDNTGNILNTKDYNPPSYMFQHIENFQNGELIISAMDGDSMYPTLLHSSITGVILNAKSFSSLNAMNSDNFISLKQPNEILFNFSNTVLSSGNTNALIGHFPLSSLPYLCGVSTMSFSSFPGPCIPNITTGLMQTNYTDPPTPRTPSMLSANLPSTVYCNSIGVQELSTLHFSVFPNPSVGIVEVRAEGINVDHIQMEIYDLIGQRVMVQELNSDVTTIDLSALPSGNYIYRFVNSDTIHSSGPLVILRN